MLVEFPILQALSLHHSCPGMNATWFELLAAIRVHQYAFLLGTSWRVPAMTALVSCKGGASDNSSTSCRENWP